MNWFIVAAIALFSVAYFFRKSNTIYLSASETKKGVALINKYLINFQYFQNLSPAGRSKFIKRIVHFINSKKFIGHHGLEVTGEMRVLVAASAVQLTFGLKKFILSHYHTIRLYPEAFYSKMLDAHLKGGTSEGGTISLSWADFKDGYADPEDKYNLGLHEMAHALKLDLIKGYDFDDRFAAYFDQWNDVALIAFKKMATGSASFLREYGATNMHEFFAVCVEHFFEVPEQLKKELPHIYYHLAFLLNQDPLNIVNDYSFSETLIKEAKNKGVIISSDIRRTSKYDTWHWSFSLMMIGIFFGTGIVYYLTDVTIISLSSVAVLILITGLIGLLQWPFFKNKVQILNFPQFILYCIFGVGFTATASILLLNFLIPLSSRTEEHEISYYYINKQYPNSYVELSLEKYAYQDFQQMRKFDWDEALEKGFDKPDRVVYHINKGLFGIDVLKDYKFYKTEEKEKIPTLPI